MTVLKGQIVSEANDLDFNSSKKRMKTSALVARAKNSNIEFVFLEELRTRKNASEIN